MHTSELKVSEMTKRATEQSVPPALLLEPGIVDQGRRQRPAQAAALFDLFLHPAQTYMEDGLYALFCVCVGGEDPCTYISFGGLGGQCPPS